MTQIIAQRYHILEELGQGGMGTVYRGLDARTQQTVAVKHLKPQLTTPELVERFVREGHALRELNHPNIVKMLDSVEEDGNHYLIIEYLAGGDLNNLLKRGQQPIEKVLQLAIDICDALTRAHRLDIIHRDLKPANVLLADDGTPRLTDFGIARIGKKERVTATDAIVGTVDYLAPEVLDDSEVDARADIWAFGVMLFEILAGERPFKGVSVAQTLMAIVTQPVPDLEALRPDAPVALIDLIYRMLEKSRDARIRSVRQVGLELEDILHGRTQQTPPETRFAPETPNLLIRPKHNLPAQTTPFVGREAELVELARLLNDTKVRLITILASGGMGKTRLALEAAEQQIPHFDNGVYFVELAPLSDPANIVSAIAEATSYQFQSDGREPKQQILDFLANKNLLLVLDNFEHLLQGASLVTDILKAAPQVKILATSRQRLSQSGETLFNLEGMDFPAWETPEDALEYAAVKLFMQSAKRAKPDFELTSDNMDAIARICKLVQGMPLGIVLAAAWLSMLSPDEIAAEIVKGIDFLESELTDLPERHQSIRAVFDYSWDLLTDDEKQVFIKLSVFRGGFTREAAEAVAAANLRVLISLMNKSLIRRDADSGRYEIHELLRQYAEEILLTRNIDSIQLVHAGYYLSIVKQASPELRHSNQLYWYAILDHEVQNIKVAMNRMHDVGATQQVCEFVINLAWYWLIRDQSDEIMNWFSIITTYSMDDFDRGFQANVLLTRASYMLMSNRNKDVASLLDKALDIYQDLDDKRGIANTLLWQYHSRKYDTTVDTWTELISYWDTIDDKVGLCLALSGYSDALIRIPNYDEAKRVSLRVLDLARELGDRVILSQILGDLGNIWFSQQNHELAIDYFSQALKPVHELNDQYQIGRIMRFMGNVAQSKKDYMAAEGYYEKAFQVFNTLNSPLATGWLLTRWGTLAFVQNQFSVAGMRLIQSFEMFLTYSESVGIADNLERFSRLFASLGDFTKAAKLFSRGNVVRVEASVEPFPFEKPLLEQDLHLLQQNLGEEAFNAAWEAGKALDLQSILQDLSYEFRIDA